MKQHVQLRKCQYNDGNNEWVIAKFHKWFDLHLDGETFQQVIIERATGLVEKITVSNGNFRFISDHKYRATLIELIGLNFTAEESEKLLEVKNLDEFGKEFFLESIAPERILDMPETSKSDVLQKISADLAQCEGRDRDILLHLQKKFMELQAIV